MEILKRRKVALLLVIVIFLFSCAGRREGSFRRIKGKKVWIPGKNPKLKSRYEGCYDFSR